MGQSPPGERGRTINGCKGGRGVSGKRSRGNERIRIRRAGGEELDPTMLTTQLNLLLKTNLGTKMGWTL